VLFELVNVVTADGARLHGAFSSASGTASADASSNSSSAAQPSDSGAAESKEARPLGIDAVICIHGTGSNFYGSSLLRRVGQVLQGQGLDLLLVNTRGHDGMATLSAGNGPQLGGAAYEIVDDCRADLSAWLDFLAQRGLHRIVLLGHSLGALKSIYALAHDVQQGVVGLLAISPARLSHQYFLDSPMADTFRADFQRAEELCAEGRGSELFPASFPMSYLVSARAFVDKYGPAERYNVLRYLGTLPCPAMVVFGSGEVQENVAFTGLPDAIEELAAEAVQPLDVAVIAGADHFYSGCHDLLASRIRKWLRRTFS
jgi:pimeloyl-ACP methyl ester carboxylesterase